MAQHVESYPIAGTSLGMGPYHYLRERVAAGYTVVSMVRVVDEILVVYNTPERKVNYGSSVVRLRNDNGQYLYLKRNHKPLGWCLPGGHIEEGETPEQAAVREVKEETGLTIDGTLHYKGRRKSLSGNEVYIYEFYYTGTEDVIISPEHDGYIWSNIPPDGLAGNTLDFINV